MGRGAGRGRGRGQIPGFKTMKGRGGKWLSVINKMGFDHYFLIVYDFVKYRSDSDVKIYYSPYKTDAKWRNSEKKKLFH